MRQIDVQRDAWGLPFEMALHGGEELRSQEHLEPGASLVRMMESTATFSIRTQFQVITHTIICDAPNNGATFLLGAWKKGEFRLKRGNLNNTILAAPTISPGGTSGGGHTALA